MRHGQLNRKQNITHGFFKLCQRLNNKSRLARSVYHIISVGQTYKLKSTNPTNKFC